MTDPTTTDRPILDDHFHLDPRGDGVEAVKRFARSGGTHLVVVHKPYEGHRACRTREAWRAAYGVTLDLADRVREATDVRVLVALGPHPAELVHLAEAPDLDLEAAKACYVAGLDEAARLVAEGQAAAIGEVGRPHWEVAADVAEAADACFVQALERAAEADCPAILHTEVPDAAALAAYAGFADRAGLPRERLVKHFCPPLVEACADHGIWPSIVADRDDLEAALAQGTRFLMETDYMDDPDRPGAVKGARTVPRRTRELHEAGLLDEEGWWRVHRDNPRAVYGDRYSEV